MAVSSDVMDLVALLDAENFSAVAGEILTEIALGRVIRSDDLESEKREPIPDDEQLRVAIDFLKLRLTEPARHLVEAEEIAGELSDGEPVPIVFADANGDLEWKSGQSSSKQPDRRFTTIAELEEGLERLAQVRSGLA